MFLREGDDLRPIAFHGGLTAPGGGELEVLATRVGVGVTGRVAETGEPLLIGDAAGCEFGRHIAGTATIEESLLAVPLAYRTEVVGVIVVSKLGLDQFDTDDLETHPELGERILAPIAQLEDVRPIVRACHERYDGTGYPDRLAGEEIPLEARIIFVCDAFHAMTSDRPYRARLSTVEARRRLEEAAGTQFDPRVVDACLRVLAASPGR